MAWNFYVTILPHFLELDKSQSGQRLRLACEILGVVGLFGMLRAAFMNPGIVPRQDLTEVLRKCPEEWRDIGSGLPKPRYVVINGISVAQKFCSTCAIYRPPRSKHCAFCNNCVLRFDHHCSWIGNCVGLRNYRYFFLFISSTAILLGIVLWVTAETIRRDTEQRRADDGFLAILIVLIQDPILLARGLYFLLALGIFVALALLTWYHITVIAVNLTTNEHIKDYYEGIDGDRHNPFDERGWLGNCTQVCCQPEKLPRGYWSYSEPRNMLGSPPSDY